jgi:hypothetical protein
METGDLNALALPSGPRSGLTSRRDALQAAMAPCSKQRAASLLASLGGMAARSQPDPETARALAVRAVEDLSDVSEWALAEAVRAYRIGDIGDGHWRPTAGELRIEARKRERRDREELWRLNRVLDHPAIDAGPIKKIDKEQFAELQAILSAAAVQSLDPQED